MNELLSIVRMLFGVGVAMHLLAASASAQAYRPAPIGIEANFGLGGGRTAGDYRQQSLMLMAGEIQLTTRLHETRASAIALSLSAAVEGAPHDALCEMRPDGTCRPNYPDFSIFSAVLGWENATATTRVSTGPVYVRDEEGALGWSARWDGAVPLFLHLSLTASARGFLIPDYNGDSFQMFGLGLGVRLR